MNTKRATLYAALICLLALTLSACGSDNVQVGAIRMRDRNGQAVIRTAGMDRQEIRVRDGEISIHNDKGSMAQIKSNGDLRIAGQPIHLKPAQRLLTTQYYTQVHVAVHDGRETGRAGAKMAGSVIGSLFTALFKDDSHVIGQTANAQNAKLNRHLDHLCEDLQSIKSTQDQLIALLPAFAPYAAIDAHAVNDCHSDAKVN
jgi:hypothetical protein